MFFFSRYLSLAGSQLFQGFTDWHCHLLPGVDDGVQTLDETLRLLALYEQLGVSEVWFTPHIMEDIPNTPQKLQERFGRVARAYQGSIALHLAAEHMLDPLFEKRLQTNSVLPIGNGRNHLLVETSCFNPPVGLQELLQGVLAKGYYPLLAHPERYVYMDKKDYRALKALGVRFQLNLPALVGAYGREVQARAVHLLATGSYDAVGTDTHSLHAFRHIIGLAQLSRKSYRLLRNGFPDF